MRRPYVQVSIEVDDIHVRFHCAHGQDRASYRITPAGDDIDVYLSGTPEQLGAFADAIVRAVSAHTIAQVEAAAK